MDEWKKPYQDQLKQIVQVAEAAEEAVVAAEQEATTWPETREKINTIVLIRLQQWLDTLNNFLRSIDLRPLFRERRRLIIWRGITWHHIWPLRVRLRNLWLQLQILLLKLWSVRKWIALFVFVLLFILSIFWMVANWDMIREILGQ